MYNVILILLHRPFVSDGHLHSNARSITVNSLLVCVKAATAIVHILRLYHEAYSVRRAPYLISYATYVSATIHVRIAAKRQKSSDAHKSLATCLEVFRVNQESNWAARRAQNIVEGLAKKLKIELPDTGGALALSRNGSDAATAQFNPAQTPAYQYPHPHPQDQDQTKPQEENNYFVSDVDWQQGFSPNMDVDGIIQSFARQQDTQHPGSLQNAVPNGMDVSGMPQHQSYLGDDSTGHNGHRSEQQVGDAFGASWTIPTDVALDDMLFGFNSSTLDGFSMAYDYGQGQS
jgi:hypothetical protein